ARAVRNYFPETFLSASTLECIDASGESSSLLRTSNKIPPFDMSAAMRLWARGRGSPGKPRPSMHDPISSNLTCGNRTGPQKLRLHSHGNACVFVILYSGPLISNRGSPGVSHNQ